MNTTTGIYGRIDLFSGTSRLHHSTTVWYLNKGLTEQQKREALALVRSDYPVEAYGTSLNIAGDQIIAHGNGD